MDLHVLIYMRLFVFDAAINGGAIRTCVLAMSLLTLIKVPKFFAWLIYLLNCIN